MICEKSSIGTVKKLTQNDLKKTRYSEPRMRMIAFTTTSLCGYLVKMRHKLHVLFRQVGEAMRGGDETVEMFGSCFRRLYERVMVDEVIEPILALTNSLAPGYLNVKYAKRTEVSNFVFDVRIHFGVSYKELENFITEAYTPFPCADFTVMHEHLRYLSSLLVSVGKIQIFIQKTYPLVKHLPDPVVAEGLWKQFCSDFDLYTDELHSYLNICYGPILPTPDAMLIYRQAVQSLPEGTVIADYVAQHVVLPYATQCVDNFCFVQWLENAPEEEIDQAYKRMKVCEESWPLSEGEDDEL
jgi:hypothetical protein